MLQVHIINFIQLVSQLVVDWIKEGFREHNLGPNVVQDAHKFNPLIYSLKFRIQPWTMGFKKDVLALLLISSLLSTYIKWKGYSRSWSSTVTTCYGCWLAWLKPIVNEMHIMSTNFFKTYFYCHHHGWYTITLNTLISAL
jgi:hypothetical protein